MVGTPGEPRLGAAWPRGGMGFAALLSVCLLVLLQLPTLATLPSLVWKRGRRGDSPKN